MDVLIIISQALLYVSFALITGYFVIYTVPERFRPSVHVPDKWIIGSLIAVPILSFMPVLYVVLLLSERFGFFSSLSTVLTSYKIGFSWDIVFLISAELFIFFLIMRKRPTKVLYALGAVQILLLIAAVSWASHAVTMAPMLGFFSDFLHVVAVSLWVGLVLMVSWFSSNYANWEAFLKWFSPVAISAFGVTAISGLLLTDTLVPHYMTGVSTDYGQGLLIKHLLLIPLVFYALINGVFIKIKMKNPTFDPRPWVKIEAILLLAIFVMTALFSQFQPPTLFLAEENVSKLFLAVYDGAVESGMFAFMQLDWWGLLFIVLGVIFIALIIVCFFLNAPIWLPMILGFTVTTCFYLFMMSTVIFKTVIIQ